MTIISVPRTNYYALNEPGKSHDVIIRLEWLLILNENSIGLMVLILLK